MKDLRQRLDRLERAAAAARSRSDTSAIAEVLSLIASSPEAYAMFVRLSDRLNAGQPVDERELAALQRFIQSARDGV